MNTMSGLSGDGGNNIYARIIVLARCVLRARHDVRPHHSSINGIVPPVVILRAYYCLKYGPLLSCWWGLGTPLPEGSADELRVVWRDYWTDTLKRRTKKSSHDLKPMYG